jgi:DNA repair exonuclease SbcCD nuclease subunit
MKFLHIADIHLGCRRYNLDERTKDFFRSWHDVILRHAIPNEIDFLLIAGDFFDTRKVSPQAMNHAMAGLELLREHNIPVLAIEGNHDQREAVSDFSWLRSLSQWGYLKLLEPTRDAEGHLALVPWNDEDRSGSYVDIKNARIFGSHWYGASANNAIPILSDALRRASVDGRFNILMLHTDVEGQINRPIPALSVEKLKELKQLTGYIALGHTHKRFDVDNWAFNPGSLEAVKIDEYKEERGVYLVEVDDEHRVTAKHLSDYVQRPFQRLSFDVSGAVDAETVYNGVMEKIEREARKHDAASDEPEPIIEINLKGQLGFKNSLLEINRMRDETRERTGALHVIMRNQSVPVEYAVAAGMDAQAPRHERERRIIEDLIARNNRFKHRAHDIAELVIESKRLALSNEAPDKILDLIAQKLDEHANTETGSAQAISRDRLKPDATADAPETDAPELIPNPVALSAIERNAMTAVMSDE